MTSIGQGLPVNFEHHFRVQPGFSQFTWPAFCNYKRQQGRTSKAKVYRISTPAKQINASAGVVQTAGPSVAQYEINQRQIMRAGDPRNMIEATMLPVNVNEMRVVEQIQGEWSQDYDLSAIYLNGPAAEAIRDAATQRHMNIVQEFMNQGRTRLMAEHMASRLEAGGRTVQLAGGARQVG